MTSKEALEKMCSKCCYCPFDINSECHCDEYNVIKNDLDELNHFRNKPANIDNSGDEVIFSIIRNHKDNEIDYSIPYTKINRQEFNDAVSYAYYALRFIDGTIKHDNGDQYIEIKENK